MFTSPGDSSFMKGDTFLEVATCLARTDVSDMASFAAAVETVKRYVRAKIKKGKGKEVSGPKGKLEALELKYGRLGYQDVFYLVRLHLGLPPSSLTLPRPTSPVRHALIKAGYPLPAAYLLPANDERRASTSTITPESEAGPADGRSVSSLRRMVSRGRDPSPRNTRIIAVDTASIASVATPLAPSIRSVGSSVVTRDTDVRARGTPHRSECAMQLPRIAPQDDDTAAQPLIRPATMKRMASGNENDMRRLLEARIRALEQSALVSLDVQDDEALKTPPSAPISPALSASSTQRYLPPAKLPPCMPLPPTPAAVLHAMLESPARPVHQFGRTYSAGDLARARGAEEPPPQYIPEM